MIKFIPAFSCWKVNSQLTLILASCAKTHEVRVYALRPSGFVEEYHRDIPLPDFRELVPCRWHALSAVQRASVRDHFGRELCRLYGDEGFSPSTFAVGVDK